MLWFDSELHLTSVEACLCNNWRQIDHIIVYYMQMSLEIFLLCGNGMHH